MQNSVELTPHSSTGWSCAWISVCTYAGRWIVCICKGVKGFVSPIQDVFPPWTRCWLCPSCLRIKQLLEMNTFQKVCMSKDYNQWVMYLYLWHLADILLQRYLHLSSLYCELWPCSSTRHLGSAGIWTCNLLIRTPCFNYWPATA